MSLRTVAATAGWLLVLLVVLSLAVGHLLGQPILLGYVTSASMEPTIDEGEGFVSIPQPLSGEVEEGDVIVFEARELHGGGLTTHRVVEVRDDGYVTKGDANPFTDQDGDEPLVRDQQVVAEALQVRGTVVTIPHVGTVAGATVGTAESVRTGLAQSVGGIFTDPRGFGFLLITTGIGLIGLAAGGGGRRTRTRARGRSRAQVLKVWSAVGAVALVIAVVATAAMVLPAGVQEFGVAAEPDPGDDPLVVEPGGSAVLDYEVRNSGPVPTVAVVEPRGGDVAVEPDRVTVGGRSSRTLTATVDVPDEEGVHFRTVAEHRYFAVLPPPVIGALHDVHPLLALLAVDLVIGGFVGAAGLALLGTDDLRVRSVPSRSTPGSRAWPGNWF